MPCTSNNDCDENETCRQHLPKGTKTCQPLSGGSSEHHCKANKDCEGKKGKKGILSICKDVDGKRICIHPSQCLSNCQTTEFCSSKQNCERVPECTSDEDCSEDQICKVLPTGLNACEKPVEIGPPHECGRSSDCAKDRICKEDENKIRKCALPYKCYKNNGCLGNKLCDVENECRTPLECSSSQDCPSGQTCQAHIKGKPAKSGNRRLDPKTCHPDVNIPPTTLEECDMTQDCIKDGEEDRVCKVNSKGEKGCVSATRCKSQCETNEICDSEDKCKAVRTCRANFDCKANEICKRQEGTMKIFICHSKPDYPEVNQCGSNQDCKILDSRRTVCKEERGLKSCVAPEQCLASCSKKELCGPQHTCKVPQYCTSSQVCKTQEECKQLAPGMLATCQPSPPDSHQCGWSKDCELLGGENTLCMELGGQSIQKVSCLLGW